MKYQIASKGNAFHSPILGDTVWGYTTSEEKAMALCEKLNNKSNYIEEYYYYEDTSPIEWDDINLDYMAN